MDISNINNIAPIKESSVEPSKHESLAPQLELADNEPAEPRASIETLCSLDISENIPRIVLPMDAEDSPWGGRWGSWPWTLEGSPVTIQQTYLQVRPQLPIFPKLLRLENKVCSRIPVRPNYLLRMSRYRDQNEAIAHNLALRLVVT